jgi:hypothetical protein
MLLKIILWGAVVAFGLLWLSRRASNKRTRK